MLDFIKLTLGHYAGSFMLFWGLIVTCACISLAIKRNPWSLYFDAAAFWTLALMLVSFVVMRPLGIAPDDLAYLDIYNRICPATDCKQWIQGTRDWGWYSLIGLLKSLWDMPRTMLIVAGAATAIKFWIIFKLSKRPLWALLFFAPVFFLVQDLTGLRLSLALAFFMLAIYLLNCSHRIIGVLMVFLPGLIHLQALMSPMIFFAFALKKRYKIFVILAVVPVVLVLMGLNPTLHKENLASWEAISIYPVLKDLVSNYITLTQAENYHMIRPLPYSYIPFVLLIVVFSFEVFKTNRNLFIYCAMSFAIACWMLWLFAGWQEPQVRFFEYFALPAVLLVGNFRAGWLPFLSVVLVSGIFVVRYNVLHPLILG